MIDWRKYIPHLALLCIGAGAGFAAGRQLPRGAGAGSIDLSIRDGGQYRVRKVVDGDTIVLDNGMHVRYHGINTPESGRFVKNPDPLSPESVKRNTELVEGKYVRIHPAGGDLDIHGRVVAKVFVDNPEKPGSQIEAGKVLIKEGLARAIGLGMKPGEYQEYKALQDEAKSASAGLWGLKESLPAKSGIDGPFFAASGAKTYHRAECPLAKRIQSDSLHEYASEVDADFAGLAPCYKCLGGTKPEARASVQPGLKQQIKNEK